jgi:topoisomerase-4 subunit A
VGKDIIHIAIFKKNDERTTYNMIYRDGPKGITFMKRFNVTGVTREKEYDLTKGTAGSEVFYFTVNPNGETDKVQVQLRQVSGLRKFELDVDFAELPVKARSATGNIVTKYSVKKVLLKEKGKSTLLSEDIWFDDTVHRLNKDGRGTYLGKFAGDDKILTITSGGYYRLYSYDLLNHFEEDLVLIEKFYPQQPISVIFFDPQSKSYWVKRFIPETNAGKTLLIPEQEGARVELVTTSIKPVVNIKFNKEKDKTPPAEDIDLTEFVPIMGMKAKGKKLSIFKVKEINLHHAAEASHHGLEEMEESGLSPMELHRRAMEKISRSEARDFMNGDGEQTKLPL